MDLNIPFDALIDITKSYAQDGKWVVEGYAATDDLDLAGDMLSPEALKNSVNDIKINTTVLRNHNLEEEVGNVLDVKYVDGKIWVKVLVSKTVPDVWQKIKEKTLNKFSVRMKVIDAEKRYVPSLKQTVNYVKKMKIVEVSLVSVAMNEMAKALRWYVEKAMESFENSGGTIPMGKNNNKLSDELEALVTKAIGELKAETGMTEEEITKELDILVGEEPDPDSEAAKKKAIDDKKKAIDDKATEDKKAIDEKVLADKKALTEDKEKKLSDEDLAEKQKLIDEKAVADKKVIDDKAAEDKSALDDKEKAAGKKKDDKQKQGDIEMWCPGCEKKVTVPEGTTECPDCGGTLEAYADQDKAADGKGGKGDKKKGAEGGDGAGGAGKTKLQSLIEKLALTVMRKELEKMLVDTNKSIADMQAIVKSISESAEVFKTKSLNDESSLTTIKEEIKGSVTKIEDILKSVTSRLDKVENAAATRKSIVDEFDDQHTEKKSEDWGGFFPKNFQ